VIKLRGELDGRDHEITIHRRDAGFHAEIDGRRYDLQLRELDDTQYLLIHGDEVYNCRIETAHKRAGEIEVSLRGVTYAIRVIDPKRLRSAQSGAEHAKGSAQILAPMPGKVVRVLVDVGTQVEADAGILVVEAMKMQNELKSPKAGTVVSLNATVGATVNAGDVLAVVE
jgi:biotin carboxyl carrier protein